jgi:hypothetical protein
MIGGALVLVEKLIGMMGSYPPFSGVHDEGVLPTSKKHCSHGCQVAYLAAFAEPEEAQREVRTRTARTAYAYLAWFQDRSFVGADDAKIAHAKAEAVRRTEELISWSRSLA